MTWTPERLKALRKAYGETQREFADRMGVKIGTITYWETTGKFSRWACKFLDRIEAEQAARPRELQTA